MTDNDADIPVTIARCCSICHKPGHRSTTCPKRGSAVDYFANKLVTLTRPERIKGAATIHRKQVLTFKDLETVRNLAVEMTGGYEPEDRDELIAIINRFCDHFDLERAE
jgi:hypothetical protein